MSHPVAVLLLTVGLMLLAFAALHDIGFRTVPNYIPATILLLGMALRFQQGDLAAGFICGVVMFSVTYAFWRFGWIGGADAKLLSACAVFMPPSLVPAMIVSTSLTGGVLAVIYLLAGRLVRQSVARPVRQAGMLARVRQCELRRLRRRGPLPYAAAIAAGSWLAIAGL